MASSFHIYESLQEYEKVYGMFANNPMHQVKLIDMFIKGDKLWIVTNTSELKEKPELTRTIVHFRNGSIRGYMEGDEICITFDKIRYNFCNNNLELHPRLLRKPLMSIYVGRYHGEKLKGKKKINYEYRFYDLIRDRINLVLKC
jgi:hypothetical protein